MKIKLNFQQLILIVFFFLTLFKTSAQELYSAEGYWKELNKVPYSAILNKKLAGKSLTDDEMAFLKIYEEYLASYYQMMSEKEKEEFALMKNQRSFQPDAPQQPVQADFNLRTRDRLVNGIYGAYYGASLMAIAEVDESGFAVGIPLIMAGAWQLGPVINKEKYENISLATIRAGNTGKLLGAGYGASLGLVISGESQNNYKWILGLSTIGSIAMGEIAFQNQKKKELSEGYVEMMRLYGFLGPIVTGLGALSIDINNTNLLGGSLVAGGVAGLLIGNRVAKNYDYTPGDADAISSLMLISGGLGATVAVESIDSEENTGLLLIPAATAVAGTLFGQKAVKGVRLTKRQGSTINLASGGAALIGLGAVAMTSAESPGWYVGTASVSALIMHQALFSSYKKKNFENRMSLGKNKDNRMQFSMKVTPENFFVHKQMTEKLFWSNPKQTYPIVNFKLSF